MKKHTGYLILSLFLLSGCVEKEILDDIGIEIARSYDSTDEEEILGTTLIYNVQPDKSVDNTTFSTTATTSRDLMNKLQRQSSDHLSEGSLEVILFGKELAEQGLIDYLDAPLRNASIGARLFLLVVDGEAQETLNGNFGSRGNAIYLSNLMEHNIKNEDIPRSNLQLFFHDHFQRGQTPFLPQIKKISEETLEINGISLFKGDKLKVVDTIEPEKMFFFKLLVDRFSEGSHKIQIGEHEAVLRSITSKHNTKLLKRNPHEIVINIKIQGILREYNGKKLTKKELIQLEKTMNEETNKECEALIKRFQEKKIDPVGLGFFIKTKTRGFNLEKWEDKETYQNVKVKVNTDVRIIESGVIE
jgi:spore germination protein